MSFTSNSHLDLENQSNKYCLVCGDSLCPHGICRKAEPEYACDLCPHDQDAYSIVMDAMKYVSIVSGPAMDAKGYRAFMDAMKIFSQATREIWEAR